MQKYRMESFNRWNRDRVGGHHSSPILENNTKGHREYHNDEGRRFMKRRVNKQRRREHVTIIQEGIESFYEDRYLAFDSYDCDYDHENDLWDADYDQWLMEEDDDADLYDHYDPYWDQYDWD